MIVFNFLLPFLQEIPNVDPINYTKQLWDMSPLIGAICTPLIGIIIYFVVEGRSKSKKHEADILSVQQQANERINDLKERIEEKDAILLRVYDERRDDERHTLEVLVNLNALTKQIISSGKEQTERVLDAIRNLDKSVSDFKNVIGNRL